MSARGFFSSLAIPRAGQVRQAHRHLKMAVDSRGRDESRSDVPAPDARTMLMDVPADTDDVPIVQDTTRVAGWMVIRDSDQAGRFFTIYCGRNRIGTEADMAVVVTDAGVMPWHATLIAGPHGEFLLIDQGSPAGTFLNGRRVSRTRIVDNDVVRFASTTVRFKSFI